ncbi:hypothetical protein [Natronococcus occultus]|uniref:Uncharacterized protein n=1 Tax=Natronococcus occultus SP4 TaxID=694430 RepID=L0K135_9EURY|nr:hypothetical protein [Natronococcus occultus]AGB38069.1 hypothetical protein Natoc_2291 [Natronococcus occultus SP4]
MRGLIILLRLIWRRRYIVLTTIFGTAFVTLSAWVLLDLSVGDIPDTAWVAVAVVILAAPYAIFIAAIVVGLVAEAQHVFLHVLEGETGNAEGHELSQAQWEDLVVLDWNDNEVGKERLVSIDVSRYGKAVEVDAYNPETNTARTSYMGETSNREIRRFPKLIEAVKEKISPHARAYSEMHAKMDLEVEDRAQDGVNSFIAMFERVSLPPELHINKIMNREAGDTRLDELPDPNEALDDINREPSELPDNSAVYNPETGGGDE